MSTLVIKNLPETLHDKLRRQAQRNHRSVTKEAVTLIEAGVTMQLPREPPLQPIKLAGARGLSAAELEAAIADGRYASFKSQGELDAWMDELRADRDDMPQ